MTVDEHDKVVALTQQLFPAELKKFKEQGTVGQALKTQLQWKVYHALSDVGLL